MVKLKAEVKKKWLEALRSGSYQQGKQRLRVTTDNSDSFCCLGVLCDITDNTRWMPVFGITRYGRYKDAKGAGNSLFRTGFVPDDIADQSFMDLTGAPENSRSVKLILIAKTQTVLSQMNDEGKSFNDIADWIEANL